MPIIYEKKLACGCVVKSLEIYKENNIIILGSHEYKSICNECKHNYTEDTLYDKLEIIYKTDYKVYNNCNEGWIKVVSK